MAAAEQDHCSQNGLNTSDAAKLRLVRVRRPASLRKSAYTTSWFSDDDAAGDDDGDEKRKEEATGSSQVEKTFAEERENRCASTHVENVRAEEDNERATWLAVAEREAALHEDLERVLSETHLQVITNREASLRLAPEKMSLEEQLRIVGDRTRTLRSELEDARTKVREHDETASLIELEPLHAYEAQLQKDMLAAVAQEASSLRELKQVHETKQCLIVDTLRLEKYKVSIEEQIRIADARALSARLNLEQIREEPAMETAVPMVEVLDKLHVVERDLRAELLAAKVRESSLRKELEKAYETSQRHSDVNRCSGNCV